MLFVCNLCVTDHLRFVFIFDFKKEMNFKLNDINRIWTDLNVWETNQLNETKLINATAQRKRNIIIDG